MSYQKLHIKIFITFIGILAASEIIVFLFLKDIAIGYIQTKNIEYVSTRVPDVKQLIEEKIDAKSIFSIKEDHSLTIFIKDLGEQYQARYLLVSPGGSVLIGDENIGLIPMNKLLWYKNYYHTVIKEKDYKTYYYHVPIAFSNSKTGALVALFDQRKVPILNVAESLINKFLIYFLVGIGIGVAILLYPASILITKPLRKLKKSAQRMSKGDLSLRMVLRGQDEIGRLSQDFNHMAHTINELIGNTKQLTTDLSHELRSPLARIGIAAEIIQDDLVSKKPGNRLSELDNLQKEIEDMDQLIRRILMLSKLDEGDIVKKQERLNLVEMTENMVKQFNSSIRNNSISLTKNITPDFSCIYANANDIRIVLSNLLDNAKKYTPANGEIKIDLDNSTGMVKLAVTNTCNTLPNDNLDKLFEPFYRPVDQPSPGAGLGLSITKKIINRYSGNIRVFKNGPKIVFEVCFVRYGDRK